MPFGCQVFFVVHKNLFRNWRGERDPGLAVGAGAQARLALLFSGQGAQRLGMGRELHARFAAFARAFDAICAEADPRLGRSLADVVFGVGTDAEDGLLDRTELTQPAVFAVEVALFRLLESFGVRPDYLIGHSLGEVI